MPGEAVVALVLGTIASVFVSGRWNRAVAAWIAPACFLLFLQAVGSPWGLLWVWLAVAAAMLASHWRIVPVPPWLYGPLIAVLSIPVALPYVVNQALAPRLPGWTATLVFPLALVAVEYIGFRRSPFGTWGATAYTQANNRWLVPLLSVTGIWGAPFLIGWLAALIAWSVHHHFEWARIQSGVAVFAAVWVAVLLFTFWRLVRPTPGRSVTVATVGWPEGLVEPGQLMRMFAASLAPDEVAGLREKFERVYAHFVLQTRNAAKAGARIIVWPEANVVIASDDWSALQYRLRDLARELSVYLVAGIAVMDSRHPENPFENRALLVAPDGQVPANYLKSTAVPGLEARRGRRGDGRLPIVETPYGRLAVAVCYDLDFPWLIRQAGQSRADVLLVPASDWKEIGSLHHDAARLRAVENGVAMVRSTRWGISALIDANGHTVASLDHHQSASTLLVANLTIGNRGSLYARFGDFFAWIGIAGLVILGLWAVMGSVQ